MRAREFTINVPITIKINGDGDPEIDMPTVQEIRAEIDANSTQLSAIRAAVESLPDSTRIADDVWNYSLRELSSALTPEEFWNFLLSSPLAQGSAGEKLKQVLTTGNFLALK